MAGRIFEKTIVTLLFFIIVITAFSIVFGIFLARLFSKTYMNFFKNLTEVAQKRLKLDKKIKIGDNERIMLQKYIDVLIADQEKLRDYEKVKSWKDGARLLMHELKNPLTPLKLSVQSLVINGDNNHIKKDDNIHTISTSLKDIENIMTKFKEFVNIEFGKKEELDLLPLIDEIFLQVKQSGYNLKIERDVASERIIILSEKTLLKMLFSNLINNGIEANPDAFYISVKEKEAFIKVNFITKNRSIENPNKIFRSGYSEKGEKRGFGLFLCKQISDYLDLDIQFENKDNSVIFSITIKKEKIARQPNE